MTVTVTVAKRRLELQLKQLPNSVAAVRPIPIATHLLPMDSDPSTMQPIHPGDVRFISTRRTISWLAVDMGT